MSQIAKNSQIFAAAFILVSVAVFLHESHLTAFFVRENARLLSMDILATNEPRQVKIGCQVYLPMYTYFTFKKRTKSFGSC
jgi:hypothetical protein